jgi:cell division protein FtsQ
MRQNKSSRLRGSVTQNNMSVRMRAREQTGVGFLARLGLLAAALLILIGMLAWLWHVGWPQKEAIQVEDAGLDVTQKAQFAVKDIVVEGRHQISKDDVLDALGIEQGAPILGFDSKAASARLAKLPWVKSVIVERRLPDTITVILTEREAAARWQHDDHLYVIDTDGHVLPTAKADDFPALPLVVGTGADKEAQNLFAELKTYPDISRQVDSAVRVSERRWDLHLHDKVTVKLPEEDFGTALHRLSVLISQERILDRPLVSIDLRIPDRLIIEPDTGTKESGGKKP